MRIRLVAAAATLLSTSAFAAIDPTPPDAELIVIRGDLEWVYAAPCAALDPSCGAVDDPIPHGFAIATDDQWLASFGWLYPLCCRALQLVPFPLRHERRVCRRSLAFTSRRPGVCRSPRCRNISRARRDQRHSRTLDVCADVRRVGRDRSHRPPPSHLATNFAQHGRGLAGPLSVADSIQILVPAPALAHHGFGSSTKVCLAAPPHNGVYSTFAHGSTKHLYSGEKKIPDCPVECMTRDSDRSPRS
jgi:hypothetical protein